MTPSLLSPLPSCACYSWPFLLLSICTLWLDRNEDIPHIAFDTLHALAYLNLHDIVHRNLSPENMLLNPKVKLSQSANCDNKPLSRHNNNNYMWGIFGEIFPNYYQVNSLSRARGKKKKDWDALVQWASLLLVQLLTLPVLWANWKELKEKVCYTVYA